MSHDDISPTLFAEIRRIHSFDDLKIVQTAIKEQWNTLSALSAQGFQKGDSVYFTDKYGHRVDGTVTKVNRKSINLMSEEGKKWRVSAQLLSLTDPS